MKFVVAKDLSLWNPWLELQVDPFVDIVETIPINTQILAQARAAL